MYQVENKLQERLKHLFMLKGRANEKEEKSQWQEVYRRGCAIQCKAAALTGKRPSVPLTGGRSGNGPGGHRSVMGDSVMRMKR